MSSTSLSIWASTPAANIRAVILDYGKVLCCAPTDEHVNRVADFFGFDQHAFWAAFEKHRPLYDLDLISCEEYWQRLATETGTTMTSTDLAQLQQWDLEMWTCLEPSMIRWAESLKGAGYKLAMLSNLHIDFANDFRARFEWFRHFDTLIFSADLKIMKPDPAIYAHCLEQLGIEAQQALFVDDCQDNVEGARGAGINAIQFTTVDQLREELQKISFAPLPDA